MYNQSYESFFFISVITSVVIDEGIRDRTVVVDFCHDLVLHASSITQ
jgi:hypothetical protein